MENLALHFGNSVKVAYNKETDCEPFEGKFIRYMNDGDIIQVQHPNGMFLRVDKSLVLN